MAGGQDRGSGTPLHARPVLVGEHEVGIETRPIAEHVLADAVAPGIVEAGLELDRGGFAWLDKGLDARIVWLQACAIRSCEACWFSQASMRIRLTSAVASDQIRERSAALWI
jgi:hypothetical protein